MVSESIPSDSQHVSLRSRVYPVVLALGAVTGTLLIFEATKVIAASVLPLLLLFGEELLLELEVMVLT